MAISQREDVSPIPAQQFPRLEHRRSIRWQLGVVLLVAILSGLIGEAYAALLYPPDWGSDGDYYRGFRTGFFIGGVTTFIEVFYTRSQRQSWLRRVPFWQALLVRILAMTVIIRIGLIGNDLLTDVLLGEPVGYEPEFGEEVRDTLFAMALVVIFVVITQLSSIIGFKRFANLVFGRYFRPVNEERIFLFVDLIDSTPTAKRLGDVRFHQYLSEFFYQLDAAIVRTGGEIVSYVGDSVIVTWPLTATGKKNARCLKAVGRMMIRLEELRPFFEAEFGETPRFRAALHGGSVVVGECGDSRRQVTFLGDVVNMTARIESLAKSLNEPMLVSAEILERIELPDYVQVKRVGSHKLKGAETPFELHRLDFL